MAQDKPKPGLLTRRRELKSAKQRLQTLRSRRASEARTRLLKRQEGIVKRAEGNLERQERVARGESALPEPTTGKKSAQQGIRDRIKAERELGLRRGGN